MRTIIAFTLVAVILSFVAGCGPGQPFEIESMHTPQPDAVAEAASSASSQG